MGNILSDYLAKYISLSAGEKKAIIDLDIFKHYKKGTLLLKKGQYSDKDYFVTCVEDSILIVANSEMEKMIFQKFLKFKTLYRILSEELLAICAN